MDIFYHPHNLSAHLTPHNRIVPSADPDASILPSGENATLRTELVCPLSVRSSRPLAVSHNLMVLSPDPEASVLPSGENATLEFGLRIYALSSANPH
jgi:hypothetical protein